MATYYRTGVETYSIIGTAEEKSSLEGRIPDGSTYFAVDENMFYTFYDGTWYETLPEAARLYHDDVGTDTKPIKLVGGVATVVANELAEDSKVVHLTGNETVDGEKSFIKTLRAYKYRCEDATAYGSTANKGAFVFVAKNEQGVMVDYASAFLWQTLTGNNKGNSLAVHVRSLDGTRDLAPLSLKVVDADYTTRVSVTSHLPVDSGGNHLSPSAQEVINSSMLAVDPRIVHTTGAETVAGNKTFTGYTYIDNPRFKRSNQTLHGNGEWVKFYEFLPVSYGGVAVIKAFQTYYIYTWVGAEIRIRQGTPTSNPDAKFYNINGIAGKLARRASDGVVEVWLQNTTTSNLGVLAEIVVETGGSMKVASATSQTAPAVGDTYSYVTDIQA